MSSITLTFKEPVGALTKLKTTERKIASEETILRVLLNIHVDFRYDMVGASGNIGMKLRIEIHGCRLQNRVSWL